MTVDDHGLLSIYLNDHLAGATAGVELVRRMARSNEDDEEFGPVLAEIRAEIEADRATLERAMELLDIRPGRLKPAAMRVAERLGRLKLNGRLRGYSPLSRLLELEILEAGVAGKRRLWRALDEGAGERLAALDLAALDERAGEQIRRLGALHAPAVRRAFG